MLGRVLGMGIHRGLKYHLDFTGAQSMPEKRPVMERFQCSLLSTAHTGLTVTGRVWFHLLLSLTELARKTIEQGGVQCFNRSMASA